MNHHPKARPRALMLTPRFPYPVVGGDKLRIYQIAKAVSERFDLTLLSLCESRQEERERAADDDVFKRVECVYLPKWKSIMNALRALRTSEPLQIAYYRSGQFEKRATELLPSHDIVIAHLIRTGQYIRGPATIPKVLEMTDAISLNYERAASVRPNLGVKRIAYYLERARLKAYERNIACDFDLVSLVSAIDRDYLFPAGTNANVVVAGNGIDLERFPFRVRTHENTVIAFVGNMTTLQNLDACWYFTKSVLPVITRRRAATFRIVGKITDSDARKFRRHANVEVTGLVPSISGALEDATLAVCPVRIGAGIQNKILEYMALGLPVITSPVGLEGLGAIAGKDVLMANSPADYLGWIEKLSQDRQFADNLAQNGRRYVESEHDWSRVLKPLLDELESLITRAT